MTAGAPLLVAENLRFAHPGEPPVVDGASFTLHPGVTALQGDTGTGKTTLLRLLAGEWRGEGRLTLRGLPLLGANLDAWRQRVFWCDPAAEVDEALSAAAHAARLAQGDDRHDPLRWAALVEGFALAPHLEKPLYMLSTGSRRKVALAAALSSGRPLVLLDEPTAALDAPSVRCLWQALEERTHATDQVMLVAGAEAIDRVGLAGRLMCPLA